jgi:hypothetical protein
MANVTLAGRFWLENLFLVSSSLCPGLKLPASLCLDVYCVTVLVFLYSLSFVGLPSPRLISFDSPRLTCFAVVPIRFWRRRGSSHVSIRCC